MPDDASKPAAKARPAPMKFGEGWLRDCWYFACQAGDLKPGKLQRYELLGEPVLLGRRRDGAVYAIKDICPHRAAPLSAGKLVPETGGGESIECPYHGWRFGTDGGCTAIPSLVADQALDISRIRVRRYPAAEADGVDVERARRVELRGRQLGRLLRAPCACLLACSRLRLRRRL